MSHSRALSRLSQLAPCPSWRTRLAAQRSRHSGCSSETARNVSTVQHRPTAAKTACVMAESRWGPSSTFSNASANWMGHAAKQTQANVRTAHRRRGRCVGEGAHRMLRRAAAGKDGWGGGDAIDDGGEQTATLDGAEPAAGQQGGDAGLQPGVRHRCLHASRHGSDPNRRHRNGPVESVGALDASVARPAVALLQRLSERDHTQGSGKRSSKRHQCGGRRVPRSERPRPAPGQRRPWRAPGRWPRASATGGRCWRVRCPPA